VTQQAVTDLMQLVTKKTPKNKIAQLFNGRLHGRFFASGGTTAKSNIP
jgi:hypothetical protein